MRQRVRPGHRQLRHGAERRARTHDTPASGGAHTGASGQGSHTLLRERHGGHDRDRCLRSHPGNCRYLPKIQLLATH